MRAFVRWHLLFIALLLSGCGQARWSVEQYVNVDPKEEKYVPMTPPPKDMAISVTAKSGGIPIELYLVNANNQEEAERIIRKQDPKSILASRIGKVDPQCEGKLSAANGYVIVVVNQSGTKTAPVTVTITEKEVPK